MKVSKFNKFVNEDLIPTEFGDYKPNKNGLNRDDIFSNEYSEEESPKKKLNSTVYKEFENELKDLLNGYSIFLSRDEMIDIIKKIIK